MLSPICFFDKYTNLYFKCMPLHAAVILSVLIIAITHPFLCIFFLTYHNWYWFIAFWPDVIAIGLLIFALLKRNRQGVSFFVIYQVLFMILILGTVIWLIVILCHPTNDNFVLRKCGSASDDCVKQVRITTGVYSGVFLLFFVLNIFPFDVLYNYVILLVRDEII